MRQFYLLIIANVVLLSFVNGQTVSVKSNLLYDITTTINVGAELGLAPQWTLDVSANYNPWQFSNDRKLKQWLLQPEVRYWLCEKFNGHFFGLHAHYGVYNFSDMKIFGLKDYRYEGNLIGAGLSYGYHWILNKRWSLEASLGLGYAHLDYEKFECGKCGEKIDDYKKHYIGPTKAAISIIYIIK